MSWTWKDCVLAFVAGWLVSWKRREIAGWLIRQVDNIRKRRLAGVKG